MRVHVVSDVHGSVEALARAGDGADALICLGDLILFIDYDDHAQGIFPELFGADQAERFIALRTAKRFDEARAMSARLWASLEGDPREHIERIVRRQYESLFAAMPTPAYLTYGNVDLPRLWGDYLRPGLHVLDGQTVELGGLRFGFVGGGLRTQYRTPYEISDEEFAAKVEAVGEVDVLCCHIPLPCPNCSTTWWPGATSAAARRPWPPSGGPSRATRCSATSTSRSTPARGSAGPSA
ncbi:metallophosphoesterase family protein [Nonomuraea recticatena]|uniref:metallophosphoesterase family protein n=1 Tax=Nonomuraea recticatena TaxID=46178 RepID=UPI003605B578